jgi:methionyl aminopeptidase
MFRRKDRVEIKTPDQILVMREAGLVVARTLELLRAAVEPGVSTADLDAIAEESIRSQGAVPSFLGYHGYPASICASVNDEVVHGIPGGRVLAEGDQISLDCGAIVRGWHGDAAITVGVGEVAPEFVELSRVTEEALWAGLAAAQVGGRLNDIGRAVEQTVRSAPGGAAYGIVEEYVGHGIARPCTWTRTSPTTRCPARRCR